MVWGVMCVESAGVNPCWMCSAVHTPPVKSPSLSCSAATTAAMQPALVSARARRGTDTGPSGVAMESTTPAEMLSLTAEAHRHLPHPRTFPFVAKRWTGIVGARSMAPRALHLNSQAQHNSRLPLAIGRHQSNSRPSWSHIRLPFPNLSSCTSCPSALFSEALHCRFRYPPCLLPKHLNSSLPISWFASPPAPHTTSTCVPQFSKV